MEGVKLNWKPVTVSVFGLLLAAGLFAAGRKSVNRRPVSPLLAGPAQAATLQLRRHECGYPCADGHACKRIVIGPGWCSQHRKLEAERAKVR